MATTTTRAELRLRAAGRIGDGFAVTATGGSTSTVIDTINLRRPDSDLIGTQAVVVTTSLASTGEVRYVSANVQSTATVTLASPVLSAAVAAGHVIHFFNANGHGLYINEWNRLLDEAVDAARDTALTEVIATYTTPATFDMTSPEINCADLTKFTMTPVERAFWGVYGVDYKDGANLWNRVPGNDLRIDRAAQTIEIMPPSRRRMHSFAFRVRGYVAPQLLTTDASTTEIDPEFLVKYAAAAALSLSATRMSTAEANRALSTAEGLKREAEALRNAARTRTMPGTVKFTPAL